MAEDVTFIHNSKQNRIHIQATTYCGTDHLQFSHLLNAKLIVVETPSGEGPDYDYHKLPTSHSWKHSWKIGQRSLVSGNILNLQLIWIIILPFPWLKSCSTFHFQYIFQNHTSMRFSNIAMHYLLLDSWQVLEHNIEWTHRTCPVGNEKGIINSCEIVYKACQWSNALVPTL